MSELKQPTALFVADSHFHLRPDASEQKRLDAFLDFLVMARRVDHLFLLGDIFDFWFDYPHFRLKGYDRILARLDAVHQAGTRIHFIGGNHDIWAAGYLHQRYGTSPDGGTEIIKLGDLRIKLTHGDGLLAFDWAYSAFRLLVRTRAGIVLAKSLHPEILFALSTWLSGKSRSADRDMADRIEAKARRWLDHEAAGPWDLLVMGHLHHAVDFSTPEHRMVVLAGWFDTLGYGVLQDGTFRHLDFSETPDPLQRITP